MHDHQPEPVNSSEEKDPYDEFEERIRRIGVYVVRCLTYARTGWSEMSFHKRLGHSIATATLVALIVYTGYTIKIYKAANRTANAAYRQLEMIDRPWLKEGSEIGF